MLFELVFPLSSPLLPFRFLSSTLFSRSISFHVYLILFPLADLPSILRAFLLPRDVPLAQRMPLDSSFPYLLKRFAVVHAQNPRGSFETVLLLPLSPLGSPFHRPSLNLGGANPCRHFSLSPFISLFLLRPPSECPEYLPSADLYKVFTIFRALPLEIRLLSLPLTLTLSLRLFSCPSRAATARATRGIIPCIFRIRDL